jgi:hypothetical protein
MAAVGVGERQSVQRALTHDGAAAARARARGSTRLLLLPMSLTTTSEPPGWARGVAGIYDEIITAVIESLKKDAQQDGIDENLLDQLKQKWWDKLQSSGTLAGAAATSGLVSRVGGGAALMPPQYAPPEPVPRRRHPAPPANPQTSTGSAAISNLSAGVPRGADLYTVVHDGEPEARIKPPVFSPPRRLR